MTIAEKIRNEKNEALKDFDFETLGRFIEDKLKTSSFIYIGICCDWQFERGSLKRGFLSKEYITDCPWLVFSGYTCGYWNTSCQIPERYYKEIIAWCKGQGLKASWKGLAGFDTPDVIMVSL